jgi:hypothetical protein
MRRLYLELKNLKAYYYVPVFIVCGLVPLIVISEILVNASIDGRALVKMYKASQMYIPWFAVWWPVLIMKEYLNSNGKELLFIYRFGFDNLVFRMIFLWIWFCVHILLLFVIMTLLFHQVIAFFLLLSAQSLLMIAAAYLLAMLSRNTFIPLIITFGYCLVFWMIIHIPTSIFVYDAMPYDAAFLQKAPWLILLASALFGIGYLIEKRLFKMKI